SYRGATYSRLGRPDKALADLSRAIELDPNHADAWNNRGVAYSLMGELDKAVNAFSRSIELAPNDGEAVQGYVRRAEANAGLARFAQARADYESALARVPGDAGVHNDLAWLLATCPQPELREPARAVELASKAVDLAPLAGGSWNTLGVANFRVGDWTSAIES